jgi:hypothetical protein
MLMSKGASEGFVLGRSVGRNSGKAGLRLATTAAGRSGDRIFISKSEASKLRYGSAEDTTLIRKLIFALPLLVVGALAQSPPFTILNQPSVSSRPYPTAYYNQRLPGAGSGGPLGHLMPNSDNVVRTVMTNGGSSLVTGMGAWNTPGLDDQQHRPLYYGQSTDPVYQVSGCTGPGSSVNGQKFHATPGALYSQGESDEEIVIWDQTTNVIFQFYNWGGQLSLPACSGTLSSPCTYARGNGYCSAVNAMTGSGVNGGNGASTAGLAPFGNIIRLTEITNVGHINHGLRAVTTCNDTNNGLYPSKTVFPANTASGTAGNTCKAAGVSSANRPPNGALFFLDYTFAQLDCFNPAKPACTRINKLATWQYMLIEAATLYGITIEDTGNNSSLSLAGIESEQAYSFYQTHGFPRAQALADAFTNYMNANCSAPTCSRVTRSAPHSLVQWSLNGWAGISNVNGTGVMSHMHVADPCVALGLQGMAGGCVGGVASRQF